MLEPNPELTKDQQEHLELIQADFSFQVDEKYKKGQQQHGGNLWEKDCLQEAVDETVDLFTYLNVIQQQHRLMRHSLAAINSYLKELPEEVQDAVATLNQYLHLERNKPLD